MYVVSYRDEMLAGKGIDDLKAFVKRHWDLQQKWGAKSYRILVPLFSETNVYFVEYDVESLDKWNEGLLKEGAKLLSDLAKIVKRETVVSQAFVKLE